MPLDELADAAVGRRPPRSTRIERRGVADADGNLELFRVGRGARGGEASERRPAAADEASTSARASRARSSAARGTSAPARPSRSRCPGAVLPNGLTLERRKVRGEVSDGMILAEDEVDLGTDHAGIMLLDDGPEPGTPLADVLPLVDDVLVVESTGNRPTCCPSTASPARSRRSTTCRSRPCPGSVPGTCPERAGGRSRSRTSSGCPRYIGRLFRDVQIGPSPLWLKARLLAAGMRPISNVVDVTNYVMLALGNPLHAFDFDTLAGRRIVVRRARRGRAARTLDGTERALERGRSDDRRRRRARSRSPGSWAARRREIGERDDATSCSRRRTSSRSAIFRTSERLRMRTEGSNRWEKGVDPHLAEPAANLATELLARAHAARRWVGRRRRARRAAGAAR